MVIVILMTLLLEDILIALVVMLLQPGTSVAVAVGVKVVVGVKVGVAVFVLVGIRVGVLLGRGVNVAIGPDVAVFVGVLVGIVAVAVGVSDGTIVPGVPGALVAVFGPPPPPELDPISTYPRIVRALAEVIVREPIGMSLIRGS